MSEPLPRETVEKLNRIEHQLLPDSKPLFATPEDYWKWREEYIRKFAEKTNDQPKPFRP